MFGPYGPNMLESHSNFVFLIMFGRSRPNILKSLSNFLFLIIIIIIIIIILRSIWPNYFSLSLQVIDFKSWHNDP